MFTNYFYNIILISQIYDRIFCLSREKINFFQHFLIIFTKTLDFTYIFSYICQSKLTKKTHSINLISN